jgi:hypothetical protein
MLSYIRRTGPVTAFCRFAAILCGIAFTWACAALGFARIAHHSCGGPAKTEIAELRVLAIVEALNMYQIDHDSCPATRDDLIVGGYLPASFLVDAWGRSVAYWCTDEDNGATSAGPDGLFGTADDIVSPGPE